MAELSSFNLTDTLRTGQMLLEDLRALLIHVDNRESLPNQRIFRNLTDYVIAQFERCGSAAFKLDLDMLGWATRSLFELSFLSDYVCASDQNMQRFDCDCAIDDLEIWEKLTALDRGAPYRESTERMSRLKEKIARCGLTGKKPFQAVDTAKAVNREAEYIESYKIYSKLAHPTAWAIMGGSEEPVVWEKWALLLLLKASGYATSCFMTIAKKTGYSHPSHLDWKQCE